MHILIFLYNNSYIKDYPTNNTTLAVRVRPKMSPIKPESELFYNLYTLSEVLQSAQFAIK